MRLISSSCSSDRQFNTAFINNDNVEHLFAINKVRIRYVCVDFLFSIKLKVVLSKHESQFCVC